MTLAFQNPEDSNVSSVNLTHHVSSFRHLDVASMLIEAFGKCHPESVVGSLL